MQVLNEGSQSGLVVDVFIDWTQVIVFLLGNGMLHCPYFTLASPLTERLEKAKV